jgi:hypothetical protein
MERGRGKTNWTELPPVGKEIRAPGIREQRRRGKEIPKDLCAIFENCRDLSVKQNFPLI